MADELPNLFLFPDGKPVSQLEVEADIHIPLWHWFRQKTMWLGYGRGPPTGSAMNPTELIAVSLLLASGQPTQEAQRRAVSNANYAAFYALATSSADLVEGPRTPTNQTT